jgi:hypothetical protein
MAAAPVVRLAADTGGLDIEPDIKGKGELGESRAAPSASGSSPTSVTAWPLAHARAGAPA